MKNATTIIVVIIVLILLYLTYKYFFSSKTDIAINTAPKTFVPQELSISPTFKTNIAENSTQKVIEPATTLPNAEVGKVTQTQVDNNLIDCNSLAYRQKLSILGITLQQANVKYELAVINHNARNVTENRQKLDAAQKALEKAKADYSDYYYKCNKK